MGSMFGGGPKQPKVGPAVDPGPPPGDLGNVAAQANIAAVATNEQRRLSKRGLVSTYINGARGIPTQPVTAKKLMKLG